MAAFSSGMSNNVNTNKQWVIEYSKLKLFCIRCVSGVSVCGQYVGQTNCNYTYNSRRCPPCTCASTCEVQDDARVLSAKHHCTPLIPIVPSCRAARDCLLRPEIRNAGQSMFCEEENDTTMTTSTKYQPGEISQKMCLMLIIVLGKCCTYTSNMYTIYYMLCMRAMSAYLVYVLEVHTHHLVCYIEYVYHWHTYVLSPDENVPY